MKKSFLVAFAVVTSAASLAQAEDDLADLRARVDKLERDPLRLPAEIQPTILTEIDYRVYRAEIEGNTGFAIARFRPGLVLSPTPWFRAVASAEFAGEYAVIHDAYMSFRPESWAELSVGYEKPPLFASAVYEPVHTLAFPDWSSVVTAFGVRRDVGADVHLSPRSLPLETWVRIGNGTGSPLGNDNDRPAFYGMMDFVLGRAWKGSAADQRTFGLRLGAGAFVEKTRDRDGLMGVTPLGFVYYRPIVVSGRRTLLEGHFVGYAGPVRISVEGASLHEERTRDNDGNPGTPRVNLAKVHSTGVSGELGVVVFGEPRAPGRPPEGKGLGGLEAAVRGERLWLNHDTDDVKEGGSELVSFAVKWWPTRFLATSVDYYRIHFDEPPIEDPVRIRSWGFLARTSFFWGLDRAPR